MKFAVASAALVASAAATSAISASSISYEVEYVTRNHTTEVTVTSCSNHVCQTTVSPVVEATITKTVDGVETVYTTVCPLTETVVTSTVEGVETIYTTVCPVTEAEATATPTIAKGVSSVAAPSAASSDDEISYVDLTTTPIVTETSGVQATKTAQHSFTTYYNNSTAAGVSTFVAGANINAVGAAGLVGVVALLL